MCLERETSWQAKEGAVMGKLIKANENHTLKLHCRCISFQVYYWFFELGTHIYIAIILSMAE